ncbi:DUF296 domain-containing protein [Roseicitreum antarcticum]|uniref:PPC domain-containing protein n=2 Tax=Roseicitreum antarcticum TaxID=564137 RepID=A0A1H3AZP5_9RHOB|nr:DUF296 domain-containing protein [Roseicitreum antarcticum]SDX34871.1 hypothetical protein SAMN04488238_107188 [Roseicitreum antarcticum]
MLSQIIHPGPAAHDRFTALRCAATPVTVSLRGGVPLMQAVAEGFAAAGFDAGWLDLRDAPCDALTYLIPGLDPSGAHAAWYNGPHHGGPGVIRQLGLWLGLRDGASFLHGHGLWSIAGQGDRVGHILPFDTVLTHDITAHGWGLRAARLVVAPDPETGFSLFQPQPLPGLAHVAPTCSSSEAAPPQDAVLVTLRPNGDISAMLDQIALTHDMPDAQVLGLGSLIGPRFATGGGVDSFATEILLTAGQIRDGESHLSALVVGLDGTHQHGALARGACAVCVTCELLLIAPPR